MFIATDIIFVLFGSGNIQYWNYIPEEFVPDGADNNVNEKLIAKTEAHTL